MGESRLCFLNTFSIAALAGIFAEIKTGGNLDKGVTH